MQKLIKVLFISFAAILLYSSCSNKKNTALNRAYHNLTAHYNVYFNGKEAYNEGLKSLEDGNKDDYSRILPVFIYQNKDALSGISSNMDRAIEKSSKLITVHSITKKPKLPKGELSKKQKAFYEKKEYCNWVDDAYFLMGRAYFYKEDYYNAAKNFEFVNTEYKNDPIRYESMIWLARTKNEMEYQQDARLILDMLMEEGQNLPEKLYDEYYALYASTYLKEEKFDQTIEMLKKAIEYTKRKKLRRRYKYILAQLYQQTNNKGKAMQLYAEVLKMNPEYDMAFNAKINLASSYDAQTGSSETYIKTLKKLLRDAKNVEFQDQIYFALANIYLETGDTEKAIEHYKLSISKSESNNYQQAISYLAIADIYFEKDKYIESQPYYDSCITLLPSDYRNYQELKEKTSNLNELAKNYNIFMREDSLQRLVKLPQKELDKLIDNIIEEKRLEKERELAQKQEDQTNTSLYNQDFGVNNNKMKGSFYFYNPSAVNFGKNEFRKKWGNRKLEDNWRRINKSSNSGWDEEELDEEVEDSVENKTRVTNETSRAFYLQDLPTNDSLLAASNNKMEEALFNVGSVFMHKLQYDDEAIEAFQNFVSRFPDGDLASMAYYYLYRLFEKKEDELQALKYKKEIIQRFPNSVFAKALTNPNYIREHKNREAKVDKLYRNTFALYAKYNYPKVIENADLALQKYPDSYLIPKFCFLKAMAQGKMISVTRLKTELLELKKKFADDSVAMLAQKILDYMESESVDSLLKSNPDAALVDNQSMNENIAEIEEVEIYFFNDSILHTYVLAFNPELVDINRLRFNVINYNLEYFSNFNFKIEEKILNSKIHFLTIGSLTEMAQAMNYFELINLSNEIFDGLDKDYVTHFIISNKNLSVLLKDGNLDRYMDFYYEYYSR